MRLHLGKWSNRHGPSQQEDSVVFLEELGVCRDEFRTGCLTVQEPVSNLLAQVYFFDGQIYSVQLSGYDFPVGRRLLSGALIDAHQLEAIVADSDVQNQPSAIGRFAVERGLVSIDALAQVHQEYLLAAFGALLNCRPDIVSFEHDVLTDKTCTLPLTLEVLMEMSQLRAARMNDEWLRVSTSWKPSRCVVKHADEWERSVLSLIEMQTLMTAIDGYVTIEELAFAAGFTRAEIVHLVCALVDQNAISVERSDREIASVLLVPEDFGEIVTHNLVAPDQNSSAEVRLEEHIEVLEGNSDPSEAEVTDASPENLPCDEQTVATLDVTVGQLYEPEEVMSEEVVLAIRLNDLSKTHTNYEIAALQAELKSAEYWVALVHERLNRALTEMDSSHDRI